MKDLNSLSRHRKPKQLKLVCSFSGAFQPRPSSGKLRYAGGETRIISVDRNIAFPKLKSKVLELFPSPKSSKRPFSLVYHLPKSAEEENTPLVLVTCDDDVCCMIDQYERLESYGTHPRLWIFVCHGNVIGNSCGDFSSRLITRAPTATTAAVFRSSGDRKGPHSKDTPCFGGGDKVKKQVRANDDSLRKLVLKQQLLAKQSTEIVGVQIANDAKLGFDQETEVNCDDRKVNSHDSIVGFCVGKESRNPDYVVNSFGMNTRDDEISCGNMGDCPGSRSHPLSPTDENVRVKSDVQLNSLSRQSHYFVGDGDRCGGLVQLMKSSSDTRVNVVGNTNRENIVSRSLDCGTVQTAFAPLSCSSNLVGSVCPQKSLYSGFYSSTRSHSIGLGGRRNPRACPYHVKNRENSLTELGNPMNIKLDGSLQPGLRSSWNISKPVQDTRMYCPTSWKPSSNSHIEEVEGVDITTDYGLIKQTCSFNGPCGSLENLALQDGPGFVPSESPSLKESHLGTILKSIGTSVVCRKTSEGQIDPSTSPEHKLHEIPQRIVLEMPMNDTKYYDIKKKANLMHQQEDVNISDFPKNPGSDNETGGGCGDNLSTIEAHSQSFTKYQNHSYAQEDGVTSSMELSLHNLSLSSFKVDPRSASLAATSDVAEALLKPQPNLFDVMDEGHFSSGPQVDKSSDATSTASSPKTKNDYDEKETTQHLQFNISMDEKERRECSKFNGRIPTDLASFYTHLPTWELQAINNSDLEYIKELGSGTYGTVFYGKWKGSDVAIKKLKVSCFTEGSVEEERLVADFWKEAHLLGQLHHPNIVALYGVVTDGPVTNFATVTEYIVNGSLKQVLRRKDRTIDRRKRLIIAMDAAFGMEYLHGKDVVHFDLKSHNFLVNMRDPQRPVCKIGDLGLSKIKQKTLVSGGIRGTIPWMAPELLNAESMVTEKVDVYSFGIVMWELLTGEEPYAKMRSEEILGGIIKGTLRPEVPSWCDPAWKSLMERCWSSVVDARPAFSEIATELRAMAATMNIK